MAFETETAQYKKVIEAHAASELKGDTVPYTSVNGHMYSYFNKEGFMALRLPEKEKTAFIEKYDTTLVTAYGIVQKEYVVVPVALLAETAELLPYLEISYGYVASLKHKPTKSKKQQ
jgi:hypothetical protein